MSRLAGNAILASANQDWNVTLFSAAAAVLADRRHFECFDWSFPPSLVQMGSAEGEILSAEHIFIFSFF